MLLLKKKIMEAMLHGLTVVELRRLAFDIAEQMNIEHRFNKDNKMDGLDWLQGFRKRNPSIAIRTPEPVSIARAVGFNRPHVTRFYFMKS